MDPSQLEKIFDDPEPTYDPTRSVDVRTLGADELRDQLHELFADPVVRKVALYLRLKTEWDARERRFIRDWKTTPRSSDDAVA